MDGNKRRGALDHGDTSLLEPSMQSINIRHWHRQVIELSDGGSSTSVTIS
jgi:hypothetical protein